ncbi:sodium:solute symporter family protein [Rubrivirga sp. IMCC43871]|uniref:sodium:solute symporter family protein n=1 Tax=Rubrivirga sp. IMCC43871 TaxID=3391575 RepID=UPI003990381E
MLDLAIVLGFVGYALWSGLSARKKASEGLGEYFLAGKTLGGWRAGFSMAATQFAADTPLLVMGLVATGGVFLLWRLWIYGIAFLLMAFVFAVGWRRSGVLTDAQLTEVRYSGRGVLALRVLKSLYYGTLINCVVMAFVLVAAMRIAEVFLPWHLWAPALHGLFVGLVNATGLASVLGTTATGLAPAVAAANNLLSILLIVGFTALYSTTGGLRAVVATDVVQFALAMIGTLIYAWVIVDTAGGLGGLTDRVVDIYGDLRASQLLSFSAPDTGWAILGPFLTIVGLQWFFQMNSDGTGYLAQRSMACKSDRDARLAGVVFAWAQIVARSLIWLVIAVALLVVYPFAAGDAGAEGFVAGREILFVTGIADTLPAGARGLMLVGLLAALASTIDTHLNWGASYWSNDLYGRFWAEHVQKREATSRELVTVARISNVVLLVLALGVMTQLNSIQQGWTTSLLLGAGMGSVLVLRWLWERINLWSELAAIATSLVVAPILLFGLDLSDAPDEDALRLALMALASTVAAVGVTFVTPKTDEATRVAFYTRVRPFGWWRQTAIAAGDDPNRGPRQLGNRLALTATTAASLFLTLVGAGRLLIPAPDASTLASLAYLGAGLALIPVWVRWGFGPNALAEDVPDAVEIVEVSAQHEAAVSARAIEAK